MEKSTKRFSDTDYVKLSKKVLTLTVLSSLPFTLEKMLQRHDSLLKLLLLVKAIVSFEKSF